MTFDVSSNINVDGARGVRPFEATALQTRMVARAADGSVDRPALSSFSSNLQITKPQPDLNHQRDDVLQKFEAAVLTTFVQAMMPKDTTSVYGEGLAGDMWKAQMAEKISDQLSRNGGLGIASGLLANYRLDGEHTAEVGNQNSGSDK